MKRLLFAVLLTTASMQAADIVKTWNELSKRRDVAAVKALVAASATYFTGKYCKKFSKYTGRAFSSDTERENQKTFQYFVVAASLGYSCAVTALDHLWPNLKIALKIS